jgi:hypothetical protein
MAAVCMASAGLVGCVILTHHEQPNNAMSRVAEIVRVVHADDFKNDLSQWIVEQQPGGSVTIRDGHLVIADVGGSTVWFRHRLENPVIITYEAMVSSAARVSDLNVFWMASDPKNTADLFAPGHGRDGKFATYDGLRTYYVGYGGNSNTTTRFRRYAGDGSRPLLPEHDLRESRHLLRADHTYRIELTACGNRVRYARDGEVIFDVEDSDPLRSGWFGFRTVDSSIEIKNFRVWSARCAP